MFGPLPEPMFRRDDENGQEENGQKVCKTYGKPWLALPQEWKLFNIMLLSKNANFLSVFSGSILHALSCFVVFLILPIYALYYVFYLSELISRRSSLC